MIGLTVFFLLTYVSFQKRKAKDVDVIPKTQINPAWIRAHRLLIKGATLLFTATKVIIMTHDMVGAQRC